MSTTTYVERKIHRTTPLRGRSTFWSVLPNDRKYTYLPFFMCLDNCRELEWTCQTTSRYQNDFSEMTGNAEILRISEKTRFFQSTELLWKCLKNCKVFTQPKSYWHVQNRVVQSVEKVLSSQNQYFPRTKAIFWHVFFECDKILQ